jgi:AcrR family transcriptional regulator
VSNLLDRRAAQKARTRATIKAVAHEMFAARGFEATPIVDIAAAAGVSVQTVFNHFASKEELFFADRAEWVEAPANAVRTRAPGVTPTTAPRTRLVRTVEDYIRATADPQVRRMIELLESTPSLLAFERSLHEEAVALLAAELRTAMEPTQPVPGAAPSVLPDITAAVWMACVRSVVLGLRSSGPSAADEDAVRAAVALTDRVLGEMQNSLFAATPAPPVSQAS